MGQLVAELEVVVEVEVGVAEVELGEEWLQGQVW